MIQRRTYRGERVVIIGLGITGFSCVKFFLERGVVPKVIDTRFFPPKLNDLPYFVPCYLGSLNDVWLLSATLIVVSPGVRLDQPVLIEAFRLGIEIVGDIELFAREITLPVVAITGSNGKSTVTQLVGNMAKCAGWRVGVAGNVGVPVLALLEQSYQLYVLELSSFQLETTYSLCATAATVLNISTDHMDRYPGGIEQYCFFKRKIYQNADVCVVNSSDILTYPNDSSCIRNVSFDMYSDFADYHLRRYKGNIWIVAYNKYLFNCAEMKNSSHINFFNALPALALSDIVKIPRFAAFSALRQFSGLAHRLQLIYENRGVRWINDSKSTNVRSTEVAIEHFIITGTLHLLLGGDSKLADFFTLQQLIYDNDIHLYCFGKDGLLLAELGSNTVIYTDTMMCAVYIINRRVQKKDVVLLSPACSSLDQFDSFKIRGFLFACLVKSIG